MVAKKRVRLNPLLELLISTDFLDFLNDPNNADFFGVALRRFFPSRSRTRSSRRLSAASSTALRHSIQKSMITTDGAKQFSWAALRSLLPRVLLRDLRIGSSRTHPYRFFLPPIFIILFICLSF